MTVIENLKCGHNDEEDRNSRLSYVRFVVLRTGNDDNGT